MLYPGQYKRLIKSVRLSIPAVVGPYSNVSAKLTFLEGQIKKEADTTNPEVHPVLENTSISTSTGVNDTGMFDFNFRDERYLPFEGGGAVNSKWQLELPSVIRAFNYDTISDVLLTVSYTANEGDQTYRNTIENKIQKKLIDHASAKGLFRLVSLKHEFSHQFQMLFDSSVNTPIEIQLTENHFPYFIKSFIKPKKLNINDSYIYLTPKPNQSIEANELTIDDKSITNWESIKYADDIEGRVKKGKITDLSLEKWRITSELIKEEIDDIMILVNYRVV